jgi:two-component system alkaline phosphatase synthesis response regulator PhoP
MNARILVVDDEAHIVEFVRGYLERDGYEVLTAGDGDTAIELAQEGHPDLLVLDVMLPGRSGFDVLRSLRLAGSTVPVIMLTARDDVIDRVAGLELGADDYVVKPFEPRELVARVGAVLRRLERPVGGPVQTHFDLTVDSASRETRRGSELVPLTRTEFDILVALIAQPGRVWTREQIGEQVFGQSFDALDRTIDSHVKNLRAKLGMRLDGGAYIETVRGVGYRVPRPSDAA